MKTLALDPGKIHSWFTIWDGQKLIESGQFPTPDTVKALVTRPFQRYVHKWMKVRLSRGDEVVIERYMHRGIGGGGTVSEVINIIIGMVAAEALRLKLKVILITPSAHKNSFERFHRKQYPRKLIRRLGKKHGTWRPKLKRLDENPHIVDACTLGCYRILKREGRN